MALPSRVEHVDRAGRGLILGNHHHSPKKRGLIRIAISGSIDDANQSIFPGLPGHRPASQAGLRVSRGYSPLIGAAQISARIWPAWRGLPILASAHDGAGP